MRVCRSAVSGTFWMLCCLLCLAACSPPTRPVAKAVPTETLKVNPELLKKQPENKDQSK